MGLKIYTFFLDYYLAFILIGSQLWSSSVCEHIPGYKIDTSPSVTVQRGLCVHVPCLFTVASDVQLSISTTGIWYHVYNGNGYPIALKNHSLYQTNGHFFLTGNVYRGDCSYSIEDPLPIHEGIYYFRFEDVSVKFSYQDIQPYVKVTELTDKPTISSTRLVEGEEVTWTCTSPGRCRNITPQITWEGTMAGIRQKMYDVTYGDGSRTFHSNITFTPTKSHNNSIVSCRVIFKSNVSTVEEQMMIVEYAQIRFSPVVAAAVGGVLFLVLLIVMGAFLIKKMKKKRQSINMDLKNNVVPPEEAIQENLQSSQGDDLEYMNHGDVQYASVEFSKVKPKEVVAENMETEYSQIRKTPHN